MRAVVPVRLLGVVVKDAVQREDIIIYFHRKTSFLNFIKFTAARHSCVISSLTTSLSLTVPHRMGLYGFVTLYSNQVATLTLAGETYAVV